MPDEERYHQRRPVDAGFYRRVASSLPDLTASRRSQLPAAGMIEHLEAGDVLTIELLGHAQIVHLFAWNPRDPDERIWTHETSSLEDAFLRLYSRLWGTMARFRPLLTVVDDTVQTRDAEGDPIGRHHFVLGGYEVPAVWEAAGGKDPAATSWQRFRTLLWSAGVDPALHRDHVSLFMKMAVIPETQVLRNLPSDAVTGDRISLYAETELAVALVPSEYGGGGVEPAQLDGVPGPALIIVARSGVTPLGWPYPSVPYPDLAPYADASGRRL